MRPPTSPDRSHRVEIGLPLVMPCALSLASRLSACSFFPDWIMVPLPWKSLPPDLMTMETWMPRLGASAELATLVIEASSKTLESNQLPLWLPPLGEVVTTPSSCCQESPFWPKARNNGFAVGWP